MKILDVWTKSDISTRIAVESAISISKQYDARWDFVLNDDAFENSPRKIPVISKIRIA